MVVGLAPLDPQVAAREFDLIESFARTSGRPLSFTVQQPYHAPERWRYLFERVTAARAAGLDLKPQVATRPIGVLEGLEATANPFLFCPSFGPLQFLPLADWIELTEIRGAFEGDVSMPAFGPEWREVAREEHDAADGRPGFAFVTLRRTL